MNHYRKHYRDKFAVAIEHILEQKNWSSIVSLGREIEYSNARNYFLDFVWNKLKPFADKGNLTAIQCMYYLARLPNNRREPTDNEDEKYLSKLSTNEIKKFFLETLTNSYSNLAKIIFQRMEEENLILKNENDKLKTELAYMPGGTGYREAKTEFDTIANKN